MTKNLSEIIIEASKVKAKKYNFSTLYTKIQSTIEETLLLDLPTQFLFEGLIKDNAKLRNYDKFNGVDDLETANGYIKQAASLLATNPETKEYSDLLAFNSRSKIEEQYKVSRAISDLNESIYTTQIKSIFSDIDVNVKGHLVSEMGNKLRYSGKISPSMKVMTLNEDIQITYKNTNSIEISLDNSENKFNLFLEEFPEFIKINEDHENNKWTNTLYRSKKNEDLVELANYKTGRSVINLRMMDLTKNNKHLDITKEYVNFIAKDIF